MALGAAWAEPVQAPWKLRRLKDVASVVNGYPFDSSAFEVNGAHAIVRIRDLNSERTETRYSGEWVDAAAIGNGDVLVGMDGDFNVGTWKGGAALLNQRVCCVRGSNPLLTRFLRYVLPTPLSVTNDLTYFTTVKHLSSVDVERITVPVPPACLLAPIVSFLDDKTERIDALIAEKERLVDKLVEYWHSKAAELVVRGLRPEVQMAETGVPYLGSMPSHWQFVPLKSIFRLVAEPAPDDHGLELLSLYTSIGVRPRNELEARGNKASSTDGYWLVRENDLVVNKLLAWMGAVAGSAYSGVTSPAYDILRPSHTANTWYFDALLRSGIYLTEFKSKSRGIMEMRLRLYWEQLGTVKVPLPPKQEQDEIVDELNAQKKRVDSLLEHCHHHIATLREYRSSLISAAVTGRLDFDADPSFFKEPQVRPLSI